tara:strand:+ start:22949 stop:23770 length:822 start_codon:yes stop_codon:yes gene_type:complete
MQCYVSKRIELNKMIITGGLGLVIAAGLYYAVKYRQRIVTRDFLKSVPLNDRMKMKFEPKRYDLTAKIDANTIVYPGDPPFEAETVAEVGAEDSHFKLCKLSFSNHMGTHIDYPRHVLSDGATSEAYTINDHIKNGVIIEVPNELRSINRDFVSQYPNLHDQIVMFKTANSQLSKHEAYTSDYVYIEPDAAEYLVEQEVAMVGIDYISVDPDTAHDLPTHNMLLSNGVLIVENLELKAVPAGDYKIYVFPLNVRHADGVPARVMAEQRMQQFC